MEPLVVKKKDIRGSTIIRYFDNLGKVWFEEIEKQDWSDRMQFYLYEMHNNQKSIAESLSSIADGDTITVGDLTFTAVSGIPSSLQFKIDTSSTATAANLTNVINSPILELDHLEFY